MPPCRKPDLALSDLGPFPSPCAGLLRGIMELPLARTVGMLYPTGSDMRNDLYQRFAKYQDRWIALTPNEEQLIASSENLASVVAAAKQKGVARPVYLHIPRWDSNYAPACQR